MDNTWPSVGDTVTCAETGKQFVVERQGCTVNYAVDSDGNVYSHEGVDIRDRRKLLDRSKPFTCYLSGDGMKVTGCTGNVLGEVVSRTSVKLTRMSYTHGEYMQAVSVRDVHGGMWYGRGSPGIVITLRPYKK